MEWQSVQQTVFIRVEDCLNHRRVLRRDKYRSRFCWVNTSKIQYIEDRKGALQVCFEGQNAVWVPVENRTEFLRMLGLHDPDPR